MSSWADDRRVVCGLTTTIIVQPVAAADGRSLDGPTVITRAASGAALFREETFQSYATGETFVLLLEGNETRRPIGPIYKQEPKHGF